MFLRATLVCKVDTFEVSMWTQTRYYDVLATLTLRVQWKIKACLHRLFKDQLLKLSEIHSHASSFVSKILGDFNVNSLCIGLARSLAIHNVHPAPNSCLRVWQLTLIYSSLSPKSGIKTLNIGDWLLTLLVDYKW